MKNIVPDWFKKTSVYQINPRTFSAQGTIKAIIPHLPKLAELGFGVMYLCPVFVEDDSTDVKNHSVRQLASKTGNPKNPYRMNDYFDIDSEYGTMDDLREFVAESHRLGLRVFLDLVYFHMGPNAPVLKEHPEFAKRDENGEIILGEWNFPVLNYDCAGLREYLWCNMTYYIGAIGVDGFRCDVADLVPLDFWEEGKRRIKAIKPEAVMINEGTKAEYLDVFDANYGYYWHNAIYDVLCGNKTVKNLAEYHKVYNERYHNDGLILRDMDNHDMVTDWPFRIEGHFGHDCMELIQALNYSVDGVPMVYSGNELADTARLSMFANRFYMGEFEVTDRSAVSEASERRMSVIKQLNSFKKKYPALCCGETKWITAQECGLFTFERTLGDETKVFIGNLSENAQDTEMTAGSVLLSNNAEIKNNRLGLSAYGYVIVRK
ncbi:MAG: hypothetical protein IJW03_06115 [Clostridia bacterium]|nr:hypothetical protein [Clostridia bacterium]